MSPSYETTEMIDALYEGILDPEALEKSMRMAIENLQASGGNLHVVSKTTLETLFFAGFGDGYTDESIAAYLDHWQYVNAHRDAMRRTHGKNAGDVFLCHEHFSEADFEYGAYFQDFYKKVGQRWLIGGIAWDGKETEASITFSRTADSEKYDDTSRTFVANLLPHIRRAVRLALKIGSARSSGQASLNNTLSSVRTPSYLVSNTAEIVWKNPAGAEQLSQDSPITVNENRLTIKNSDHNRRLKELIASVIEKPIAEVASNFIRIRTGSEITEIEVLPATVPTGALVGANALALVMVRSKGLNPDVSTTLKAEHGLTDAECRLAVALADGASVDDIAKHAGTSLHTVRTQLRSVFSKTGVNRQSALAALIWKSA